MQSDRIKEAATLLVKARSSGERLAKLPEGLEPQNAADGYAIQDAVIALQGAPASWKLGPPKPGVEPKCAPVSAQFTFADSATLGRATLLQQSPEIEVEIAARLSRDLGPRSMPYAPDEVAGAIGSLHLALEVVSSRFQNRKATAPFSVLADGQSNGVIVYGEGIADWRAIDLAKVRMKLDFEGRTVATAESGASTDLVLHDLTWLANHVAKRSGGLRAGQIVITGARISPVSLPTAASRVRAEAPLIGAVSATFA